TVVTDFKFTPQNAGSYRFDYLTVDAHGNEVATSIQRDGIKLSSNSIQVKVVEDYATDATSLSTMDFDALTNVDYLIPTQAYIANSSNGVDVEFPAIYAQGGWGDYSNLKLTRTIWKNGNQIATLENTTHEVAGSPVNYKPNETAIYNFTSAGSYEVRYRAEYVDAEGTTITSTTKTLGSFSIEVKEMTAPTEAEANLTITAPSVTTAVMKNDEETITFNAPTVSDSFDKNIQVDVTFAFDSSASDTAYKATKNANGTYSIDVKQQGEANAEWTSATKMIVTFKATNDLGNTKQVTKEVQLVNYSNDNVAPVIASSSVTATYNASTKKVELPEVTFNDANTNTSLVLYVIKDNKVIDIYNAKTGLTATMKAFEYEPAEEGDYAFTYVATDQNYNTSTISLHATVDFQLGYSVAIEQVSTQEYGAILDLTSIIHVTEDGQSINIADSNVIITPDEVTETDVTSLANSSLLIQVKGAYSEVPGVAGRIKCLDGDITIKAWVKDANGVCDFTNNASSTITFASKDTIAPEFKIENESEGSNVIASYEFADSDAENTHVLPWFDAESIVENGVGVDYDTMKIELFYTNSTEAFATFNLEDANTVDGLNYVVNKEGKVTAKYTVADLQGNTNTRSFIINIGDVLAPEIVLTDDAITSTTKVGETFTIDLEEITLANDETLSKTDDLKVKITLNGAEFTDWSYNDGKTAIEFTAQEGDFVISFDVTDDAGNVATTVSKKYTVKSESVTPTNTTTVWGTIMIIISLVIVGLVVFFFVKPSKEKSVHNKSKKTK
ncbi:MAG: hypothetical protein J6C13_04240, partial [Clostridia bacterium]|nr:hypothetical protein [Clostridia bacterium]